MKLIVLIIALFFSTVLSSSQNNTPFSKEEYEKANTAENVTYLTQEEKEVIRQLNLARMDGEKYYNFYIKQFINFYNITYAPKILPNNTYLLSLKEDAKKIKKLQLLYPDVKLSKVAAFHAHDMGETGRIGHTSSDGTTFSARIRKNIGSYSSIAENCSYGFDNATYIVGQLLVDDNTTSFGHRKNIFDPKQRSVGVCICPHKTFKSNCVMDFYVGSIN